ncbi:beta-glucosidase 20-like [Oryza brachyantha]|uniref:beta-glucosidase 20-like n=1 Tax=Oryza brachyantha TaxID=4533 RepID=UPI0003EAAC97|nr:beta-glucosidase 20-like [Oryza brachyantha]
MGRRPLLLFLSPWLLLLLLLVHGVSSLQFTRDDFPDGFVFGAGTAAYQYEGAAAEDGRRPSIWDTYTHSGRHPEDGTGDVASDGYHKYKEDVKLMGQIGLEAYRFTISWSRLIPTGRGAVNPKGLQFYNSMINELVKAGIQIHVVLYHMDLPQSLQDEYGGWISPKFVEDFAAYAGACFREFGDRVAHWTTVLEPNAMAQACYDVGILPPNRCSYPSGSSNCTPGDSTVEPYLFMHHALLAHASAVKLYREKYQVAQKGIIGINIYSMWFYPFTNSAEDIGATERTKQFIYGWILNPLVFGDYPEAMKKAAGSRLPFFSSYESELVKNAFDFIGLNHYTSVYTSNNDNTVKAPLQDLTADIATLFRDTKNDTPSPEFVPGTLVDPLGLEHALEYIRENYGNLPIYIQENGSGAPDGTCLLVFWPESPSKSNSMNASGSASSHTGNTSRSSSTMGRLGGQARSILNVVRVIPPNDDEKKPLWRYVELLEKTGKDQGGNARFRCRFSNQVIHGSYSRVKAHLLKIGTIGVATCKKVTVDILGQLEDEMAKAEAISARNLPNNIPLPTESIPFNVATMWDVGGDSYDLFDGGADFPRHAELSLDEPNIERVLKDLRAFDI